RRSAGFSPHSNGHEPTTRQPKKLRGEPSRSERSLLAKASLLPFFAPALALDFFSFSNIPSVSSHRFRPERCHQQLDQTEQRLLGGAILVARRSAEQLAVGADHQPELEGRRNHSIDRKQFSRFGDRRQPPPPPTT